MSALRASLALLALSLTVPARAFSQDSSPDIDIGSTRIGGPGATDSDRRRSAAADLPVEYVTEDTLPPKESKKRIPALHTLGNRYVGGKQWIDACEKYDWIQEEGGDEALVTDPNGKKNAYVAYLQCAKIAVATGDFDKTERLLKKSESHGSSDHRHASIREKMMRESYRKKLANGDVNGALELFKKAQSREANEDERIWMGEELAKRAWTAYSDKREMELKDLLAKCEEVAPLNTEYRRLKEKIEGEGSILSRLSMIGGGFLALFFGFTMFSRWREAQRVKAAGGGGFEDL